VPTTAAAPPEPRPVDYRALMKKVEQVVAAIERADDAGETVQLVASRLIAEFRDELGIYGGRLYKRQGAHYVVQSTFPPGSPGPVGERVPRRYAPVRRVLAQGTIYMTRDDPELDRELEAHLGVAEFAAIEVGDEEYLLAFDVAPGGHRDDLLISLGILRHSINQKVRQERMAGVFNEARKIQASILPREEPEYFDFELWGANEPMEEVGGDFFDYIEISPKILGVAIADVSGHGLPAALQVRDVHMGLRMGLARDLKIVRTVERMNQIIHRSTLTSRFVSMFYGELEPNGTFIYVNAGHPPPFHLRADGEVRFLEEGGAVLGPIADASYERGFVSVRPGDLVVLYTDGIVEARGREAGGPFEEFGVERLVALCREHRRRPAEEVVAAVFARLAEFTGDRPPGDDRTVVAIRRRTAQEAAAG
jgi:sigma-B regulation protein RsbU (phosphoserine phosphatase)